MDNYEPLKDDLSKKFNLKKVRWKLIIWYANDDVSKLYIKKIYNRFSKYLSLIIITYFCFLHFIFKYEPEK